ncbi:RTA1 like protein-domain-containing protein [Bombardia bombarda]|uniref:RTA1 like protein-domain-containing protein n=1 Tax=Bombardia bombarda TaxID=252184 RepID=A0AA39X0Q9_9PEZI|nr:RTA1 like protein-domain-containing protein [Bombardia bombarda]
MSGVGVPPPGFRPSYDTCLEVNAWCPVAYTTLGYYPNKGVNLFLAIGFALAAVSTIFFGVWKRTWGYSIAVAMGCILECAGYVGRYQLGINPWNGNAFKTQIVSIVLGPTLICVGLYLTLKHVVSALNPSLSRVPPRVYPLFFVPADVSCLVIQAIGGGIAASAGRDKLELLQHGNRVIIAGIVLQVVVLGLFGAFSGVYLVQVRRWIRSGAAEAEGARDGAVALWGNGRFRMFLYAMMGAYSAFLVRCVYRIAEMAGGWGNHIMQDEPSFVVLESFMVLIGSGLLAAFAPGVFFPQMGRLYAKKVAAEKGSEEGGQGREQVVVGGVKGIVIRGRMRRLLVPEGVT